MTTIFPFHLGPSINDGCKMFNMSLKDRVESKPPSQSRLLNTLIWTPLWDGTLHASKSRNKFIFIYFIALQPCLIPAFQSSNVFLQTSYFHSLTETLEWSIVFWLVNHSNCLNGQWLVSQSPILRPSLKVRRSRAEVPDLFATHLIVINSERSLIDSC